jgi:hypothetical protein
MLRWKSNLPALGWTVTGQPELAVTSGVGGGECGLRATRRCYVTARHRQEDKGYHSERVST